MAESIYQICPSCSKPIIGKRPEAKYCGKLCATTASKVNQVTKQCLVCAIPFTSKSSADRKYCSKDCSRTARLGVNVNTNQQRSSKRTAICLCGNLIVPELRNNQWYQRKTCSINCLSAARSVNGSKGGKASAASQTRRSKDEIALYHLIAASIPSAIPNYMVVNGWDADIYLPDHKIAILWNGPWHYKELGIRGHSLHQVRTRDKLKLKAFSDIGIKVFIFEDRYHTPTSAFKELVAAIGVEPIWPVRDAAL